MISDCDTLDIVVQYFDSWVKDHQDALRDLFTRAGRVRMILPDPGDADSLAQIKSRFLESEQDRVEAKIRNTSTRLESIYSSAGRNGELHVRCVALPIWYCALRFSNNVVALSPFESKREVGVNSPCMILHESDGLDVIRWFDKEFDHLWTHGERCDQDEQEPVS
jgi:hypothetical protein